MELEHPELCDWGDMPMDMVKAVSRETHAGTVVQCHNNGEPLCYPYIGDALRMFGKCILQFNTNGKLLVEKADEIIDNLDVLTVSVIENDPEGDEQYETVKAFLHRKAEKSPRMVYRILGEVDNQERWERLPGIIARRTLHKPEGSRDYRKAVTVPEIGICLDLLTHLAIDRYGNISMCVRFDPMGDLRLGNIQNMTLQEAWHGRKRREYLRKHIEGRRNELPGCSGCHFYGVPTG